MNRSVYVEEALDMADSYWELAERARAAVEYLMRDDVQDTIDSGLADRDYYLQVSAPSSDLETNLYHALHDYERAEHYYLRAATEYYVGRPDTQSGTRLAVIQRLPDPLREELALLHHDYERARAGGPHWDRTSSQELTRTAEHVSAVRERVESAIAPTRASEVVWRSR